MQEIIHLPLSHVDPVVHLALLEAHQYDFIANFVAEFVEADAVMLNRLMKLGQRHPVLLGNATKRLIKFRVTHLQACLLGKLQLYPVRYDAFQQLFFQHLGRGRLDPLFL